MYQQLIQLPLGHLSEQMLEDTMDNIYALQTVSEQVEKLAEELHKRLFGGIDAERCKEYDNLVSSLQDEHLRDSALASLEAGFQDVRSMVQKKIAVMSSLMNRDADISIKQIDRKAFTKAVLKAQPDIKMECFTALAPMFEVAKVEDDFSELDNLINE